MPSNYLEKKIKRQSILVKDPDIKSRAAYMLLIRKYYLIERNEWLKFRDAWVAKQPNLICFYCECECNEKCKAESPTIDHKVPTSRGGGIYDEDNLVIACYRCNTQKANKTVEEFLEASQRLPRRLMNAIRKLQMAA